MTSQPDDTRDAERAAIVAWLDEMLADSVQLNAPLWSLRLRVVRDAIERGDYAQPELARRGRDDG